MTDKLPKTIQFFLPQGERGIRIADITTRIVQAAPVLRITRTEAAKRKGVAVTATLLLKEDRERMHVLLTSTKHERSSKLAKIDRPKS
jgi:hypothetical protein